MARTCHRKFGGAIWLICSRDRLGWEGGDLTGGRRLHILEIELTPLNSHYTRELAVRSGFEQKELGDYLFASTGGLPFFLELCLDACRRVQAAGPLDLGALDLDSGPVLARCVGHMSQDERTLASGLAMVTVLDSGLLEDLKAMLPLAPGSAAQLTFDDLRSHTICRQVSDGLLMVEPSVGRLLRSQLEDRVALNLQRRLLAAIDQRLSRDEGDTPLWLLREGLALSIASREPVPAGLLRSLHRSLGWQSTAGLEQMLSSLIHAAGEDSPATPALSAALAELLRRRGQFAEAQGILQPLCGRPDSDGFAELTLAEVQREMGRPDEAARRFSLVMQLAHATEWEKFVAGVSLIDRLMVLGRYRDALDRASQLDSSAVDPHRRGLLGRQRGQILRAAAAPVSDVERELNAAEECFASLGDSYQLARLDNDRADLLLATDPRLSLAYSEKAISVHGQFGAAVELGKAWTYRAHALLILGDLDESLRALDEAKGVLQSARYLSGLDRIRLVDASAALRNHRTAQAILLARQTIAALVERNSHRSLLLAASAILQAAGDSGLEEARSFTISIQWLPNSEVDMEGLPRSYARLYLS